MTSHLQLISHVATGGFSVLEHVRDRTTGVEYVTKRAQPERRRAEEQLLREGKVLERLHHDHIVHLYEAGEDEQCPYLLLEWIDGETLAHIIDRAPLEAAALRTHLTALLLALQAVHESGYTHADVNESNMIVRRDGCLKLIDFGNASPLADLAQRTMADANVGSVHHMAPELFSGRPPTVASDLYGVGVTAWHALSRAYPFDGDTPAQVITAHLRQACPLLPASPFSGWICRLLERDPALRPTSALAALELLPSV